MKHGEDEAINLSKLDFKFLRTGFRLYITVAINLSKLDFKSTLIELKTF